MIDFETERENLLNDINSTALNLNILYTWANSSRKIGRSADLMEYFNRIPDHENKLWYFQTLAQAAAVIRKTVEFKVLTNPIEEVDFASIMIPQTQRFDRRLDFRYEYDSVEENSAYSNFEYILYKCLSTGIYPWDIVQQLNEDLTAAVHRNPATFWKMFRAFRLDKILPFYRKMSDEDKETLARTLLNPDNPAGDGVEVFCGALKKIVPFEGWRQTLYLIPHIQKLMNEGVPFEKQNKPEIYMNVALALAYLAREMKSEPIAALIVKEGLIISGAHNEATKYNNLFIHAENIVIQTAIEATGDETLTDCSIFVTAEPCTECSTQIMKHQFSNVFIGTATEMGGESKFGILSSPILGQQGPPYRDPFLPENVTWGVLEDEFFHLYHDVMGWQNFVKPRLSLNFSIPLRQSV